MMLAQQLYEGADIDGDRTGLITYMRTDSLNLSADAVTAAAGFINQLHEVFGTKVFKPNPRAPEAHEAVRPTDRQDAGNYSSHLDPAQLSFVV